MPQFDISQQVSLKRSPKVIQLEGMFDIPVSKVNRFSLSGKIPVDKSNWNIGLIVGPSGTGKTSLIKQVWPDSVVSGFKWSKEAAVVDGFPSKMPLKKIVELLSSVGFSSPPAWIKPFQCLSNGEMFRVTLARALAESESKGLVVFDEFTSVVDRTVAKIGSAAVAKTVRNENKQFIAVTCHEDVIDWLQPDWVFRTDTCTFNRRSVQLRPEVKLEVEPCERKTWELFRRHHYLSESLSAICKCYLGLIEGRPAVFTAVVSFPHPVNPAWREHRTVVLPDYQGIGVGNSMSDFVAAMYRCTGKPYRSITSHPAMIRRRQQSPNWKVIRKRGLGGKQTGGTLNVIGTSRKNWSRKKKLALFNQSAAVIRSTVSFEYVGPKRKEEAITLGVIG